MEPRNVPYFGIIPILGLWRKKRVKEKHSFLCFLLPFCIWPSFFLSLPPWDRRRRRKMKDHRTNQFARLDASTRYRKLQAQVILRNNWQLHVIVKELKSKVIEAREQFAIVFEQLEESEHFVTANGHFLTKRCSTLMVSSINITCYLEFRKLTYREGPYLK